MDHGIDIPCESQCLRTCLLQLTSGLHKSARSDLSAQRDRLTLSPPIPFKALHLSSGLTHRFYFLTFGRSGAHDQYGAEPFESSNMEQLALKGLSQWLITGGAKHGLGGG